ncbi:MAG: hypothetical protein MJ158_03875, partial [Alphaproteobacteria bacterium]|nr:hypothetical protein [Alphaproteobacteria bacterium]
MKTKIIYISGSEIFKISDIKAAFDELKATLNIDKDTVLFGVPVDSDDIELGQNNDILQTESVLPVAEKFETFEETEEIIDDDSLIDEDNTTTENDSNTEKGVIVPISSILSADTETQIIEKSTQTNEDIPDIISDLSDDTIEETDNITEEQPTNDTVQEEDKSDLEKLFEEIQPLDDNKEETKEVKEKTQKDNAITNDATLKKLAKEFIH